MTRYQDIRLSKHFIMLDFMQDRDLYSKGVPTPVERTVSDETVEQGMALCENLLEPMIELYGPCSLAAGFCKSEAGHHSTTPHVWQPSRGAACDAAFHDWVNLDRAPIKMLEDMVKRGMPFERMITYAGSEYMCLAWKNKPRFALYENMRIPGQIKPAFITHTRSMGRYDSLPDAIADKPDWRRGPNEVIFHTRRSLRPQHVRLGRYFSLLDFCRSEEGLRMGIPWVLPIEASQQAWYGRMFAEVLDPVVARVGRVSVTQGVMTKQLIHQLGHDATAPYHWVKGNASLKFVLPQHVTFEEVSDLFTGNENVVLDELFADEHPSDAVEVSLTIRPFTPKTIYSGGYPYAYYSGEVPDYLPARVKAKLNATRCK